MQKLMTEDDAATAEVDKWIRDDNDFRNAGRGRVEGGIAQTHPRPLCLVRQDYEDFVGASRIPRAAASPTAVFSTTAATRTPPWPQYEMAAQLDPKNPAAWNNIANYYGEHGPLTNAFIDYAKAIELNPAEPVYYQNLRHDGLSVPQGRGGIFRHHRAAGVRQGARALPESHQARPG